MKRESEDGTGPSKSVPTTTGAYTDVGNVSKMEVKAFGSDLDGMIAAPGAVLAMDKIRVAVVPADAETKRW